LGAKANVGGECLVWAPSLPRPVLQWSLARPTWPRGPAKATRPSPVPSKEWTNTWDWGGVSRFRKKAEPGQRQHFACFQRAWQNTKPKQGRGCVASPVSSEESESTWGLATPSQSALSGASSQHPWRGPPGSKRPSEGLGAADAEREVSLALERRIRLGKGRASPVGGESGVREKVKGRQKAGSGSGLGRKLAQKPRFGRDKWRIGLGPSLATNLGRTWPSHVGQQSHGASRAGMLGKQRCQGKRWVVRAVWWGGCTTGDLGCHLLAWLASGQGDPQGQ
jgi:hypothetical protein